MPKPLDSKAYQIAIQELEITTPVYSAIEIEDGSIQITTRDGVFTWEPKPKKKKKAASKRATTTPTEASINKPKL